MYIEHRLKLMKVAPKIEPQLHFVWHELFLLTNLIYRFRFPLALYLAHTLTMRSSYTLPFWQKIFLAIRFAYNDVFAPLAVWLKRLSTTGNYYSMG